MIVLPGPPQQVEFVSSGYDSVLLRVVLPSVGTAPFTGVEVQFLQPDSDAVNTTVTGVDFVEVALSDLQDGTEYTLSVAVYNLGGKGTSSQQLKVTTGELLTVMLCIYRP